METQYVHATRLLGETQRLLKQIIAVPSDISEARVRENLEQLKQDVIRLQTLAKKEVPSFRQEANMKVDQFRVEVEGVTRSHHGYMRRQQEAERYAKEREELLTQRYKPSGADMNTTIPMEHHALQLEQGLTSSNAEIDTLLSHGKGVLGNLKGQRSMYKHAQRTLLDLSSTLGLSNTVMRVIERRTSQDMYIFWTGLFVTVVFISLLIYYFVL